MAHTQSGIPVSVVKKRILAYFSLHTWVNTGSAGSFFEELDVEKETPLIDVDRASQGAL
jgi:nucleoside phosphorylase